MSSTNSSILCPLACLHLPFASVQAASKHVRRRLCPNATGLLSADIEAAIMNSKQRRKGIGSLHCPLCGILVSNKTKLKRHSKVHQETKFTCQYCGKTFKRRDDQLRHEVRYCISSGATMSKISPSPAQEAPSRDDFAERRAHKHACPADGEGDCLMEPARKQVLSTLQPLPPAEASELEHVEHALCLQPVFPFTGASPPTVAADAASMNVNVNTHTQKVQQEAVYSGGGGQLVSAIDVLNAVKQPQIICEAETCKKHELVEEQLSGEAFSRPKVQQEQAIVEDKKLISLEEKKRLYSVGKGTSILPKKPKSDIIRFRLRYNENIMKAKGKGLSFIVIMTSCLPPLKKLVLDGEELEAQGKKEFSIGPNMHCTYYARAKVNDKSTKTPMKLWFYSKCIENIPPCLAANKAVVLGIDNIRRTSLRGVQYLSANDTSRWAVFSVTGEIMCAYKWRMPNAFNEYLRIALEWARSQPYSYASKAELFYYASPAFVSRNPEHDTKSERAKYVNSINTMNDEQTLVLSTLIAKVNAGDGYVAFLDGPAGTGKTYLLKSFLSYLYSKNIKVVVTASTGMAASIYDEGHTAHSAFGISFNTDETTFCNIKAGTRRASQLAEARVIIWDEAVSAERYALEAVEKGLAQFFCKPNESRKLFGGLVIVFTGDFRQILPIVKGSKRSCSTIKATYFWNQVDVFRLHRNMRTGEQEDYAKFLLAVGDGTRKYVDIPTQCRSSTLGDLINVTFPDFEQRVHDDEYLAKRGILTPTKQATEEVNSLMIARMQGTEVIYKWQCARKSQSKIKQIREQLSLKLGCPIMLLVNIRSGLCNGTRMVCERLENDIIAARVISGKLKGIVIELTRIQSEDKMQFPVVPCFAITINKAQGQTLDQAGVYLPTPIFCHGQLYVALSRVRSFRNLKVYSPYPKLLNIVDRSILT